MVRTKILLAAIAVLLCPVLLLQAQQSVQEIKGQVTIGRHKVKLEAGQLYEFVLDNPHDFDLMVDLEEAPPLIMMGKNLRDDRVFFLPDQTDNYHLFVFPGLGFPQQATFKYNLKIKPIALAKQPLLDVKSQWTNKDDIYKRDWQNYHKSYRLQLKAGKIYLFDLIDGGSDTDPYLFLEDAAGKVVAKDDDSGGDLNSRLIFVPEKTAEYRVIATTLEKATGNFNLKVRQAD
ncbi:MAG TPA: hypothetical protein VE988_03960 [Gemmataceae bacterium]|nr:hypothetical protein [Gemmataceae bacterium]